MTNVIVLKAEIANIDSFASRPQKNVGFSQRRGESSKRFVPPDDSTTLIEICLLGWNNSHRNECPKAFSPSNNHQSSNDLTSLNTFTTLNQAFVMHIPLLLVNLLASLAIAAPIRNSGVKESPAFEAFEHRQFSNPGLGAITEGGCAGEGTGASTRGHLIGWWHIRSLS